MQTQMAKVDVICQWAMQMVSTYRGAVSPERLGVVFDIDDTLLSSKDGSPRERVTALYRHCVHNGIRVFIVTARPESARAATVTELEQAGIVSSAGGSQGYEWLAMMPDEYDVQNVPFYKLAERRAVAAELGALGILIMSVGDQWWDIVGSDLRIEEMEKMYPVHQPRVVAALPPQEPAVIGVMV